MKTSSLKPTIRVLPICKVGARILPVGPSIAASAWGDCSDCRSNSAIFLPFRAMSLLALSIRVWQSADCSFLLARAVSLMLILFASKNLDALVQVVHPLRR